MNRSKLHRSNILNNYGAAELKRLYKKYLIKGLFFSISVHLIFFAGYLLVLNIQNAEADLDKGRIIVRDDFFFLENIEKEETKQTKITFPKNITLKDPASLTPEAVAKSNVKDSIRVRTQEDLQLIDLPVSHDGTNDTSMLGTVDNFAGIVDKGLIDKGTIKKDEINRDKNYTEVEVDKSPVPSNLSSIRNRMVYPEIAQRAGIEGKVVAKLLVGKDGRVLRVTKISGPEVFHDEVEEKVKLLVFTPAMIKNEFVNCTVSVPFDFKLKTRLNDEDEEEDLDEDENSEESK